MTLSRWLLPLIVHVFQVVVVVPQLMMVGYRSQLKPARCVVAKTLPFEKNRLACEIHGLRVSKLSLKMAP